VFLQFIVALIIGSMALNRKVSSHMLLTGLPISAPEALKAGLISHMVEDNEALELKVSEACEAVRSKSRPVVALGKRFYYRQLEMGLTAALEEGARTMVSNLQVSQG
jgi:enoyl-CoA hydratase/carnithine racemase